MNKPAFEDTLPVNAPIQGQKPAFEDTVPVEDGSGRYWSDTADNAGKEISGILKSIPGLVDSGVKIASAPGDALRYPGQRLAGISHGDTAIGQDLAIAKNAAASGPDAIGGALKEIGHEVVHPSDSFREKPLTMATNVLSLAVPAAKALRAPSAVETIAKVASDPSIAPSLSKRITAAGISAMFGPNTEAVLRRWDNPEMLSVAGSHADVADKLAGTVKKLEGVMAKQDKKAWATLGDLPPELKKLPEGVTDSHIKQAAIQLRDGAIADKAAAEEFPAKIRQLGGISGNKAVNGIRPESEELTRNVPIHLRGHFPPDEMAQMLADEGYLPPGSGASELFQKLSDLKPAQKVPPLGEFISNVRKTVIENSFDPTTATGAPPVEGKTIAGLVQKAKADIGNPVGRADHNAINTLEGIGNDVKKFGKYLSEKDTRSIIQKIRSAINYDDQSAEIANSSLKTVAGQLDDVLKSKNPAYKKAMKPLADNMDLHADIKRLFNLRTETNSGMQATETTASKLKNLNRANKDISQEALDRLKKKTKVDIGQMANDTSLAQEFHGGRPNGARRVAFGTMVGTGLGKLVGSPTLGAVTGSTIGLLSDAYGGQMAGKIVDVLATPKFAKHAKMLQEASKGGVMGLARAQAALMQYDPEYRKAVESASGAGSKVGAGQRPR